MGASTVALGFGTLIQRGDGGSTESFTTISEALDISVDHGTLNTVDATHQESLNNTEEILAALNAPGGVTFGLNYLPDNSTQVGLTTDKTNRTLRNFKIVLTNTAATEFTFAAYVTGFTTDHPVKEKNAASVTLSISGAITIT